MFLPSAVIADLPVEKPPTVQVAESWNPDSLNLDLLAIQALLTLPDSPGELRATVDLQAIVKKPQPLRLHAENLAFDTIVGQPPLSGVTIGDGYLSLQYASPPIVGDTISLHLVYRAPPIADRGDVGYHSESTIAFTFDEPYGARRWLPIVDEPYDRFQWSVSVVTPPGWIAVSNGIRPVTGSTPISTHTSITAYLAHFAAAPFLTWNDTAVTAVGTIVPMTYYARSERAANAQFDWQNTPNMIRTYSSLFGDYPFPEDGYGMVEAPIMNGSGAMEHIAMSTIGSNLVTGDRRYESIYAHELSHQWFGDIVTCGSFKHIWLNEGFATFCEGLYYEYGAGDPVSAKENRRLRAEGYFREAKISAFPLIDPPDDNLFSSTVYNKGAWVLQMLRKRIGEDTFLSRLRNYYSTNRYRPVTTPDLINAFTEGGSDRASLNFLTEWTSQAGHPILIWSASPTMNGARLTVKQTQNGSTFVSGMPLRFISDTTNFYVTLTQAEQSFNLSGANADRLALVWNDDALYEVLPNTEPTTRLVPSFATLTSYPNPTNSTGAVKLSLSVPGRTDGTLTLIDVLGREVYATRLLRIGTGERTIIPNLPHLAPGVYFWHFQAKKISSTNRMVILP